jgi:hypothetical protein
MIATLEGTTPKKQSDHDEGRRRGPDHQHTIDNHLWLWTLQSRATGKFSPIEVRYRRPSPQEQRRATQARIPMAEVTPTPPQDSAPGSEQRLRLYSAPSTVSSA